MSAFLAIHFTLAGMACDADAVGWRFKTPALALIGRVDIPYHYIFIGPWGRTEGA
jgi:hypothetical protein